MGFRKFVIGRRHNGSVDVCRGSDSVGRDCDAGMFDSRAPSDQGWSYSGTPALDCRPARTISTRSFPTRWTVAGN